MQQQRHFLRQVLDHLFEPKRKDQAGLSERFGKPEHGPSNHPYTKATGLKGASNVGEDETAGSE